MDVTPLRAWCKGRSLPFYPAMVFAVTKAMEAVDAFHYKDRDGVIVRHDTLVPSFTDLKPGSDLFQIVTVEAGEAPACGSPSSPRAVPTAAPAATTRAPTIRPGGGRSRWRSWRRSCPAIR